MLSFSRRVVLSMPSLSLLLLGATCGGYLSAQQPDAKTDIDSSPRNATPPIIAGKQSLDQLFYNPVTWARASALRNSSTNNLKQLVLAFYNYHDTHRRFPQAGTTDKTGKPLLSWRVQLLPYLEEQKLYDQFKLDEPWDSDHNKKLIDRMPQMFVSSSTKPQVAGKTSYVVVRGKETMFLDGKALTFASVRDGLSKTIMLVEAGPESAVIWTKPEDIEFDEKNPFAGLLGMREGGFLAAFADASVQFISESLSKDELRAMFTRNGSDTVQKIGGRAESRNRLQAPRDSTSYAVEAILLRSNWGQEADYPNQPINDFERLFRFPATDERKTAMRKQSYVNLKHLMHGMYAYIHLFKHFPPGATFDKAAKPLLSWRVQMLRAIDPSLYQKFNHGEAWDSEHNKKLIPQMPKLFQNPSISPLDAGKTSYVILRGKETMFSDDTGTPYQDIKDGADWTILIVEAGPKNAVIWTKPDDIEFDEKDPFAGLLGMREGGFLAAFADGSVRFIGEGVKKEQLKAMFTRAGGETVEQE